MKNLIIIFAAILMVSCKKKEVKPETDKVVIECYSKSKNATINFKGEVTSFNENNTTVSYDVLESEDNFIITLKNTTKSNNDSLNLKVTYKGITKQQGIKIVGFYSSLSYQLTEFK